jgi:hypothetical protein
MSTKHEVWRGEVIAMEGASFVHVQIVGNLIRSGRRRHVARGRCSASAEFEFGSVLHRGPSDDLPSRASTSGGPKWWTRDRVSLAASSQSDGGGMATQKDRLT